MTEIAPIIVIIILYYCSNRFDFVIFIEKTVFSYIYCFLLQFIDRLFLEYFILCLYPTVKCNLINIKI